MENDKNRKNSEHNNNIILSVTDVYLLHFIANLIKVKLHLVEMRVGTHWFAIVVAKSHFSNKFIIILEFLRLNWINCLLLKPVVNLWWVKYLESIFYCLFIHMWVLVLKICLSINTSYISWNPLKNKLSFSLYFTINSYRMNQFDQTIICLNSRYNRISKHYSNLEFKYFCKWK